MTIYVAGHSAAWTGTPTYAEMLGARRLRSGHFYFYTVMGALHETRYLDFKPEDRLVFNFGINDCIYRKTRTVQLPFFTGLIDNIKDEDPEATAYFKLKLNELYSKKPDELMQLFSFNLFRKLTHKLFRPYKGKAVVVGVAWFPKTHPTYHYATKEAEQTNNILRECASECGLSFLDMWRPPELTKDGAHYTREGHELIAGYVRENLKLDLEVKEI